MEFISCKVKIAEFLSDHKTSCHFSVPLALFKNANILPMGYGVLKIQLWILRASQVALVVKNLPTNAEDLRDASSVLGLGRFRGGEHGNLLQYSCQGNPKDRGVWWATIHRVTKSWIRLKRLSSSSSWWYCKNERNWAKQSARNYPFLIFWNWVRHSGGV